MTEKNPFFYNNILLDFFKPASDQNSSTINKLPGSNITKASVQKAQEDQQKNR